jgi:hypothetical protein
MNKLSPLMYKGQEVELLTEIIDMDEDVTKLGHFLVSKESKERLLFIDWSPYTDMDIEDLRLYLELGCPERVSIGPLDRKDLEDIKKRRELIKKVINNKDENTIEL